MIHVIINLVLSVVEICVIYGSLYIFMKNNSRTVHHKKAVNIVSFLLIIVVAYGTVIIYPNGWGGICLQLLLTVIMGMWMFHREILPIVLDVVFSEVLILCMEIGIFIVNLLAPGFSSSNYLMMGNLNMIIKLMIMLPAAWAMVRWRKNQAGSFLDFRQALSLLVLPTCSLFILYSLMELMLVYVTLNGVGLVLANMIILLLLNVYFLYLSGYLFQAGRLKQEMQIFQVQNEAQFHYYEELERKYRESRKIFHDMKNHLQAVEQLYEEQDKEAGDHYVQDLYHLINKLGEKYYSSNHMLNIILNEKLSAAAEAGIKVTAEVGDALFDDIKDIDITTIFANLLDNAIEAAVNAGEGAFLRLKVDTVQDFRVIQIRNSRSGKDMTRRHSIGEEQVGRDSIGQGKVRRNSIKEDKVGRNSIREDRAVRNSAGEDRVSRGHEGLGLANVRCTLEKYHGSLELSMAEKECRVSVMIPGSISEGRS